MCTEDDSFFAKKKNLILSSYFFCNGAGKGTRTPTDVPLDPKSNASTNSAIPADGGPHRTRTYDHSVMSRVL